MEKRISCLLLAAGRSSRMQGVNKLLLNLGGQSMIARTAKELSKVSWQELVVVTGHDESNLTRELSGLRTDSLRFVHNESYLTGMHSSIRAGLLALNKPCDAFMVCLGDQPGLEYQSLEKIIATYQKNPTLLTYPIFQGERGHPVLISNSLKEEILREPDGDYGCSYLFKRHPAQAQAVEIHNSSVLLDIDSPQDLDAYQASLAGVH